MRREGNKMRGRGGPETHGMNPNFRLQPATILIHILIRPFNQRKGGSIMIHIPPHPGLGENERFLNVSGGQAAGGHSISRRGDLKMNMGRG